MTEQENKKQEKKVHNPHDGFFRQAMSYPEVAREFFESYLLEDMKKIARLDTLQIKKDTYIDKNLNPLITDILYSVEIDGEEGYFYVLVEHMRTSDPLMPFRVLKYMIQIMDQHLKEKGGDKLPLILPIVIYNGEQPYKHASDLFKLFKQHEALAKQIFLAPFSLIDLTKVSDESLKNKAWTSILLICLKHAADRKDMLSWLGIVSPNLRFLYEQGAMDYIHAAFTYISYTGEVKNAEVLRNLIHEQLSPEIEETFMNIAQKFEEIGMLIGIQKGEQIGIQKGEQIGIQKGEQKMQKLIARNLLAENLLPPEKIAEVSKLPLEIILALHKEATETLEL
jgi:recombination-promoting nuclease RpnB